MKLRRILLCCAALLLAATGAYAQDTAQQKINKKNLVIKEWNTNGKGAQALDHVTIYSPEGKKIEEIEYDSSGNQKWRKRYEWGEDGRMARELLYNEHNRLVNYKKFDYNEFGRKKTQYTYDHKGRLINTKIFEYLSVDA